MNIISALKDLGYTTIASTWYDRVDGWNEWYKGNVSGFHDFKVWNGTASVCCNRFSLGMAKKVCEDWANLLMNEKVKVTLEGEAEQAFIDGVFKDNNFEVCMNELQEKGAARGTYAIIPRVKNATVDNDDIITDGEIALDYITAEHIFPLSWTGRDITECAFATSIKDDSDTYLYVQVHTKGEGGYEIYNHLFDASNGGMEEVPLSTVESLARVPDVIRTHSDKPQYVIGRLNIANNIDDDIPMGISVFANAVDILKACDIAYDSYVNEFVLGKKRVMVKPSATKLMDGRSVFDPNDVTFYVLPEDVQDGSLIQPIDMSLRTAEHTQGLQEQLNLLSAKCGFGEKHYQFDQGSVATATQIVSENSEMFRTIKKHELVLEQVLDNLCRLLLRMGNDYLGQSLDEDVEISIDFDDSIITDKDADEARIYRMLAAGLMKPVEARSLLMNEDEETAAAALPQMTDLATEGQAEVE